MFITNEFVCAAAQKAAIIVGKSTYNDFVEYARHVVSEIIRYDVLTENDISKSVIVDRVYGIARGITMLLVMHGASDMVLWDCIGQVTRYLSVSSEPRFVKRAKYLLNFPLARLVRDKEPKCDDKVSFTGHWRRWFRSRMKYSIPNVHLWTSWVQAKRAAMPLSNNMVLRFYQEHSDAVGSREDPLQDEDTLVNELTELCFPLIGHIKDKLFENKEDLKSFRMASLSACFEASRREGGQGGAIARALGIIPESSESDDDDEWDPSFVQLEDNSETVLTVDGAVSDSDWRFDESEPFKSLDGIALYGSSSMKYDFSGYTQNRNNQPVVVLKDVHGDTLWRDGKIFIRAMQECIDQRELNCGIQVIIEPIKGRVISKGQSFPYYASIPYQKAVHGIMRKIPAFRLIGRPVDPSDLQGLALPNAPLWFSGDYKSSTDNSSAKLGQRLNALLSMDLEYELVYRYALAEHLCEYPWVKVDDPELVVEFKDWMKSHGRKTTKNFIKRTKDGDLLLRVPSICQSNGQLMGSNVSFVILCLLNFALYMKVRFEARFEEFALSHGVPLEKNDVLLHRGMGLRRRENYEPDIIHADVLAVLSAFITTMSLKVLINGDDILFRANDFECDLMEVWGRRVGLELSVGKTYRHRTYANINSTSFHYNIDEPKAHPRMIKYFNTGLFFGQQKVLSADGKEESTLHASIDKMLEGVWGEQRHVLGSFLTLHEAVLRHECRGRNLFIHRSLGGLGVFAPPGWKLGVTLGQLMVAMREARNTPNWRAAVRPYQFREQMRRDEQFKISSLWENVSVPSEMSPIARRGVRWDIDEETQDFLEHGVYLPTSLFGTNVPSNEPAFDPAFEDFDDELDEKCDVLCTEPSSNQASSMSKLSVSDFDLRWN